jgi:quinol monooxygenase YgiN
VDGENVVTGFVQLIEIKTSRADEIRSLVNQMRAEIDGGTVLRATVGEDRDRPGYYINVVEFESYASAMENSARPEVRDYAARLAALCDQPPRFYNLHVVDSYSSNSDSTATHAPTSTRAAIGTAAGVAGVAATSVATGVAAGVAKARELLQEKRRPGGPNGPSHYGGQ